MFLKEVNGEMDLYCLQILELKSTLHPDFRFEMCFILGPCFCLGKFFNVVFIISCICHMITFILLLVFHYNFQ